MVRKTLLIRWGAAVTAALLLGVLLFFWGPQSSLVLKGSFAFVSVILLLTTGRFEWFFLGLAFVSMTVTSAVHSSLGTTMSPVDAQRYFSMATIATHIFLGTFTLAFFKLKWKALTAYTTLSVLFASLQLLDMFATQDPTQVANSFITWAKFGYFFTSCAPFLASFALLYYLKTRFNAVLRFRMGVLLCSIQAMNFVVAALLHRHVRIPQEGHDPVLYTYDLVMGALLLIVPVLDAMLKTRRLRKLESELNRVIDRILGSSVEDIDDYLNWILNEARTFFQGRRASLILKDPYTEDFHVSYVSGNTPPEIIGHKIQPNSISDKMIKYGKAIAVPNARYSIFNLDGIQRNYHTLSFMAAPLEAHGKFLGIIFVSDPAFDRNWYNDTEMRYLEIFSKRISSEIYKSKQLDYARRNATELELVVRESNNTMEILAGAFEDHYHKEDDDTPGHVGAVMSFSKGILDAFKELNLDKEIELGEYEKDVDIRSVHFEQRLIRGASLHDVGKREVPVHILRKPGKLDWPDEIQQMWGHGLATYYILKGKRHPVKFNRAAAIVEYQQKLFGKSFTNVVNYLDDSGRKLLQGIRPNFDEVTPIEFHAIEAAAHQEWYDGHGYPFALKETEIPVIGRILGVADAISVMKMRAIYDESKTWEWVYFELEHCSGTQFDPVLVKAAMHHLYERIIRHLPDSRKWVEEARQKGLRGQAARDFVPKTRQPKDKSKKVA